jgi:hypothetical protein
MNHHLTPDPPVSPTDLLLYPTTTSLLPPPPNSNSSNNALKKSPLVSSAAQLLLPTSPNVPNSITALLLLTIHPVRVSSNSQLIISILTLIKLFNLIFFIRFRFEESVFSSYEYTFVYASRFEQEN